MKISTKILHGDGIFITLENKEEVRIFNNTGQVLRVKGDYDETVGKLEVILEAWRESDSQKIQKLIDEGGY
ncbi:MAG: hypothetical protein DRO09_03615 [Thermoprotei archaeon]|nr:MAG: hypothetical protein DRO09_03615 [Thermoprotei archaeon]